MRGFAASATTAPTAVAAPATPTGVTRVDPHIPVWVPFASKRVRIHVMYLHGPSGGRGNLKAHYISPLSRMCQMALNHSRPVPSLTCPPASLTVRIPCCRARASRSRSRVYPAPDVCAPRLPIHSPPSISRTSFRRGYQKSASYLLPGMNRAFRRYPRNPS